MDNLYDDYKKYLNQCYFNGDKWALLYVPYSYQEWLLAGKPEGPGRTDDFCNKRENEKF